MAKDSSEFAVRATSVDFGRAGQSSGESTEMSPVSVHGTPQLLDQSFNKAYDAGNGDGTPAYDDAPAQKKTWRQTLAFFKTKEFWVILTLGQVLSLCDTGTNTLSTLLASEGTSIPAFQSLFNYILLTIIYTGYTWYRYGFTKWGRLILKDGWKYFILSFCDVEGNYFTVLAYRYTTILSAQLIEFWAIVVVVVLSFLFLKVRYHWAQILGILICIAGLGLMLASDHITGTNQYAATDALKGDLFALLGATFYGLSNVAEEFLVCERPMYEVVGQLGFWGMLINGAQAGIFDRASFRSATWNGKVAGYLTGYTLILTLFYSLVPILYRLSSAAFFNISLLTGNFWGLIVGLKLFHLHVHWLYPVAFVLIMLGHFVYYVGKGVLGEAKKAWLGEDQRKGIDGFATARRKIEQGQGRLARGEVGPESAGVV
jgi:solute carrier family 35, member F1/2